MFHPAQTNMEALERLSQSFRLSMKKKNILPVNPWKAKKTEAWLAKMGARMQPGCRRFDPYYGKQDKNFVNFKVFCPTPKIRIRGEKGGFFMRVEIPWDLADKILTLGFLP
jgi:hypothetical protein